MRNKSKKNRFLHVFLMSIGFALTLQLSLYGMDSSKYSYINSYISEEKITAAFGLEKVYTDDFLSQNIQRSLILGFQNGSIGSMEVTADSPCAICTYKNTDKIAAITRLTDERTLFITKKDHINVVGCGWFSHTEYPIEKHPSPHEFTRDLVQLLDGNIALTYIDRMGIFDVKARGNLDTEESVTQIGSLIEFSAQSYHSPHKLIQINKKNLALVGAKKDTVIIFDLEKKEVAPWSLHHTGCIDLSMSKDLQKIVTASRDGSVAIWDTESHDCLQMFFASNSSSITKIAALYDGNFVLTLSNGNIEIWDFEKCCRVQMIKQAYENDQVITIAPFSNNHFIVVTHKGSVQLWGKK